MIRITRAKKHSAVGNATPPALRRVVGLGLCVLDETLLVEGAELLEVRTRILERRRGLGGMAANAVAQAGALGVPAELLSVVGADADGRFLLRKLRSHGVSTRRVRRVEGDPTGIAVVLVDRDSGERRFLVADRRRLESRAPSFDLSDVRGGTVLLLDGHYPRQALVAAKRARELGGVVVADFHRPSPAARRLLPYVDHPILPREFAEAWNGGDLRQTLRDLHERFGGTPVLTLGREGSLALHEGRFRRIPAHETSVRDSTGAGDAFHGAFCASRVQGHGLLPALERASREAARCCRFLGGTGHLEAGTRRGGRQGAAAG